MQVLESDENLDSNVEKILLMSVPVAMVVLTLYFILKVSTLKRSLE